MQCNSVTLRAVSALLHFQNYDSYSTTGTTASITTLLHVFFYERDHAEEVRLCVRNGYEQIQA